MVDEIESDTSIPKSSRILRIRRASIRARYPAFALDGTRPSPSIVSRHEGGPEWHRHATEVL